MAGHGHGGGHGARGGGHSGGILYGAPLDLYSSVDPGPDIIVLSELSAADQAAPGGARPTQQQGVMHGERHPHVAHGPSAHRASGSAMRAAHPAARPGPGPMGPASHVRRVHPGQAKQGLHGNRGAMRSTGGSLHGETGSVGDIGEFEPQWGISGVNNDLSSSSGGMDPFALAEFGSDDAPNVSDSMTASEDDDPTMDLGTVDETAWAPVLPWGQFTEIEATDYDFDSDLHSGRVGAFRTSEGYTDNPVYFGFEPDMYSGFGPAPLVGCDMYGLPRG